MAPSPTEESLAAELERNRAQMAYELAVLREKLNVPKQIKTSLALHPAVWFAGSAALGFLLAQLPRSKKQRYEDALEDVGVPRVREIEREPKSKAAPLYRTLAVMALKSAFDYAKPGLMNIGKQYLAAYLQGQSATAAGRPGEDPDASYQAAA